MITHHLNDSFLMAYAAGTLPEAFSLAVAAHVEMCDECRARLLSFEAVGGVLLDEMAETATLSSDAFAATMARIKAAPPAPRRSETMPRPGVLPAALQDYVGGDLDKISWRPLGRGVQQAILQTSRQATARLLYIPGGVAVPDHGHRGTELTLVLQGAFADDTARFARGDVEIADDAIEHQPIAERGEDCICLAVTEGALRFREWLPRLAQPFLQI